MREEKKVVDPENARQGEHVGLSRVLVASLALAAVAGLGLLAYY